MPKKFNEAERLQVRQKLMEAGRRLFGHYGLKKTSVEQLTKAVGIAQGSFYLFFPSKEALFFALMEEEEQSIRLSMLEWLEKGGPATKDTIRTLLQEAFRKIGESPVFQQIHQEAGLLEMIMLKLPPEVMQNNLTEDNDAFLPVIRSWQLDGLLPGVRPEIVVGLLRSLVLMSLRRREIGEFIFEETMELLIRIVSEGIAAYRE